MRELEGKVAVVTGAGAGIRQDRPRVLVGPDTYALDAIVRLLPAAHSRLLAKPVDLLYQRAIGKRA